MTKFRGVWEAIENPPADAANMRARAELMNALIECIKKRGWTQAKAAERLGVTQPRISDLKRGKIEQFSVDTLMNMLERAGRRVEMRVRATRETHAAT